MALFSTYNYYCTIKLSKPFVFYCCCCCPLATCAAYREAQEDPKVHRNKHSRTRTKMEPAPKSSVSLLVVVVVPIEEPRQVVNRSKG